MAIISLLKHFVDVIIFFVLNFYYHSNKTNLAIIKDNFQLKILNLDTINFKEINLT